MKRISFFCIAAFLLVGVGFQPASGQNFSDAKVFENESKKVIIPNLTEDEQFGVGSCEDAAGSKRWVKNNQSAIKKLVSEAEEVVILGLQDESGNFKRGLGKCRANKVAELVNGWTWDNLFETLRISTREYQLSNNEKTKVLETHQKLLNQRGVAIVAHKNSHDWPPAWLLWLIGLIALAGLLISLFNWRRSASNHNTRLPRGRAQGRNANPRVRVVNIYP